MALLLDCLVEREVAPVIMSISQRIGIGTQACCERVRRLGPGCELRNDKTSDTVVIDAISTSVYTAPCTTLRFEESHETYCFTLSPGKVLSNLDLAILTLASEVTLRVDSHDVTVAAAVAVVEAPALDSVPALLKSARGVILRHLVNSQFAHGTACVDWHNCSERMHLSRMQAPSRGE